MTDRYEAVVYDLDGTLVHLDVDWDGAHREVVRALREQAIRVDGEDLWTILDRSHAEGFSHIVEETLADHERDGALRATRLPVADELPRSVPVGVCSLNAEAACHLALERHGLDSHVDVVVGRDTVDRYKPDPEPLLHAVRRLEASPEHTLFVGDTERDALTAERAGVHFRSVA